MLTVFLFKQAVFHSGFVRLHQITDAHIFNQHPVQHPIKKPKRSIHFCSVVSTTDALQELKLHLPTS